MDSLFTLIPQTNQVRLLSKTEKLSVLYHDIFDYPLTLADLIKWKTSEKVPVKNINKTIEYRDNYYFLQGREGLIYKRILSNRISVKKMKIAEKASKILGFVPGLKMVAVTGSLAMGNSTDASDIDLMLITKRGMLWTSRLLSYFLLKITNHVVRKPGGKSQKDKLCLNMWLEEGDLVWQKKDRNLYTAHEIAQSLPLVNKDETYEKFLHENSWILDFWPNSVRILNRESRILGVKKSRIFILNSILLMIENICYRLQYQHMKSKITRETVTKTRAIFHPHDWGKYILSRLNP